MPISSLSSQSSFLCFFISLLLRFIDSRILQISPKPRSKISFSDLPRLFSSNFTLSPMRIRGSLSSSSSSSYSSISTFSFVPRTSSFASSTNSLASSSSNSSSSIGNETRCEGLDLLVKAVLHVAGSVLGVPFTRRRVIRRRKRALRFSKLVSNKEEGDEEKTKKDEGIKVISKPKTRKRLMALPSKYHDSVLQPWKRQTRQRRSIEDDGSLG